ncbi:hypothetical protein GCM10023196_023700 [Actinoallomurus vinaceus]|uniref:Uncharacterized protein n=1 Tax=Actinoallomurus vinaceus TaxID=1080074 RepID=A0ABP8U7F1_9ACTN
MIESLVGRTAIATAAVALGISAAQAPARARQAPARADRFSMGYTCAVPLLGDKSVRLDGVLATTPSRPVAGSLTRVVLHVSRLSLRPPVAVDSWTATADVEVAGAQTGVFRLSGSGGPVAAYQPVTGDLSGVWTPRAVGDDQLRLGKVALKATTALFGEVSAPCTPREPRPVAETVTVVG